MSGSATLDIQTDAGGRSLQIVAGRRIVAELIYEAATESGAYTATRLSVERGRGVWSVTSQIVGQRATELVTVQDVISVSGSQLAFRRQWDVHSQSVSSVSVDCRVRTTGQRIVVLPSHLYRMVHARAPVPRARVFLHELSLPGVVIGSPDEATLIHAPNSEPGASLTTAESDSMPSVAYATPVRSSRQTMNVQMLLCVPITVAARALVASSWADRGTPAQTDASMYLSVKHRQLRERLRDGGQQGVFAVYPSRWKPAYCSASGPFHGLAAAHALALGGDLEAARESALFFLEGKRGDGSLCDIYDTERRVWGSHVPNFVAGATRVVPMCGAGIHLNRIDRLLRDARMEEPRIGRAVSDLLSHLTEQRRKDDEGLESAEDLIDAASFVSLVSDVQRIRGANSLRAAAAKRAGAAVLAFCDLDVIVRIARRRDDLLVLLRGLLDLAELKVSVPTDTIAIVAALLASWLVNRDLAFAHRSKAQRLGISSRGLGVVSETRMHLDFECGPVAVQLLRAAHAIGADLAGIIARSAITSMMQCTGGIDGPRRLELGAQPAEVDHTDWSSQGRRGGNGAIIGSRIAQSSAAVIALHETTGLFQQALKDDG